MQLTLEGKALDQEAIEFIQQNEPADGYTVCYSGGKDSDVVLDLVKRAGVKHKAEYYWTTIDPPQVVYHTKADHPDVQIIKPEYTMWELIAKKGFLPSRRIRFCCDYLKERHSKGNYYITGVRAAESKARSTRPRINLYRGSTHIRPILSWSDSAVWEYIFDRNLPFCELYKEGFKRLGCIGCPMTGKEQVKFEFEFFPKHRLMWLHACERLYEAGKVDKFDNGKAYFEHWIEQRKLSNQCQFSMFEEVMELKI